MRTRVVNQSTHVTTPKTMPVHATLHGHERRVAQVARTQPPTTEKQVRFAHKAQAPLAHQARVPTLLSNGLTITQMKRHKILSQGTIEERAMLVPKLTIDQLISWFETNPHKEAIMTVIGMLTEKQLDDVDCFIQQISRHVDGPHSKKK